MDQFKLKSIDELDLEFVSKSREQAFDISSSESKSLIPEISKTENVNKPEQNINNYFSKPVQTLYDEPVYTPKETEPEQKPRPLVPIGQNHSTYSPVGAPEENADIMQPDNEPINTDSKSHKKSKGALAGKIISIILLSATVVTFMLGCFITIFLDNNGSDIGGLCFSTMSTDIEQLNVSKGDLIISKKAEVSEYVSGKMIAVPSATQNGCDIHVVNYANSMYSSDNAEIFTTDITNGSSYSASVMASDCYGIVSSYVPVLGGLLTFAMENAVLVCILFVLLSAFWCLILVLIEKSPSTSAPKTKKNKNK